MAGLLHCVTPGLRMPGTAPIDETTPDASKPQAAQVVPARPEEVSTDVVRFGGPESSFGEFCDALLAAHDYLEGSGASRSRLAAMLSSAPKRMELLREGEAHLAAQYALYFCGVSRVAVPRAPQDVRESLKPDPDHIVSNHPVAPNLSAGTPTSTICSSAEPKRFATISRTRTTL